MSIREMLLWIFPSLYKYCVNSLETRSSEATYKEDFCLLLMTTSLGQIQKREEITGGMKDHEGGLSAVQTVRL